MLSGQYANRCRRSDWPFTCGVASFDSSRNVAVISRRSRRLHGNMLLLSRVHTPDEMTGTLERLAAALNDRYAITRELGAGGMATVYLAHDLKHDRDVAIKVLHPDLGAALGSDRFLTEIRTTARLQHPHILPLLDSGEADGLLYYVMPVVTGETLRMHLEREQLLPVAEAVRLAREVASALDYAHRQNVVHRDIKPENILLHDGSALVADFGIALAVQTAGGQRMTQTGMSLGTPQYMSPEQAMGEKHIDARADVYALGAMLYEMLTGDAPFTGTTVQAIVAKVLTAEPERPSLVRKKIPPNVEAAVLTALAKLPADRFATAAEFSAALVNTGYEPANAVAPRGTASSSRRDRHVVLGVSVVALLATVIAAWSWRRQPTSASLLRYEMPLPAVRTGIVGADQLPLPSPDGSFMVFPGTRPERLYGSQLWIKRRESRWPTPISGTVDALAFTISPDGAWIAFVHGTAVMKVPVTGGSPVTIVPDGATGSFGIAWLDDGMIVYTSTQRTLSIAKVPASGGASVALWGGDKGSEYERTAVVAPIAGHALLFGRCANSLFSCTLWAGDVESGEHRLVLSGVKWARYAETGQLVYALDGRLMAINFDPHSMKTSGQPVALADSITRGDLPFELTRAGTLVTREQGVGSEEFEMAWVDRTGRSTPVDTAWRFDLTRFAADQGWALSPDGSRLVIGLATDAGDQIWVKQLPAGPLSRVSFDPAAATRPHWSRDGRAVTFLSYRGTGGVYEHRADGLGEDSLLQAGGFDEAVLSPDRAWLVMRAGSNGSVAGGRDIIAVRTSGDTARQKLIVTPFDEEAIAISPDGKWIAYQSDETGRTEVFVRSFPNTSAYKFQVSNGGGAAPLWSRNGGELFFLATSGDMMTSRVRSGSSLSIAPPEKLFHVADDLLRVEYAYYTPWDVAPDGRFIMARALRSSGANATTVVIAENWLQELKARMKK